MKFRGVVAEARRPATSRTLRRPGQNGFAADLARFGSAGIRFVLLMFMCLSPFLRQSDYG